MALDAGAGPGAKFGKMYQGDIVTAFRIMLFNKCCFVPCSEMLGILIDSRKYYWIPLPKRVKCS